jgi:hypothetical protein
MPEKSFDSMVLSNVRISPNSILCSFQDKGEQILPANLILGSEGYLLESFNDLNMFRVSIQQNLGSGALGMGKEKVSENSKPQEMKDFIEKLNKDQLKIIKNPDGKTMFRSMMLPKNIAKLISQKNLEKAKRNTKGPKKLSNTLSRFDFKSKNTISNKNKKFILKKKKKKKILVLKQKQVLEENVSDDLLNLYSESDGEHSKSDVSSSNTLVHNLKYFFQ